MRSLSSWRAELQQSWLMAMVTVVAVQERDLWCCPEQLCCNAGVLTSGAQQCLQPQPGHDLDDDLGDFAALLHWYVSAQGLSIFLTVRPL